MPDTPAPETASFLPLGGLRTDFCALVVCACVLLVSSAFSLNRTGAISLTGRQGASMPGVCMAKRMTGVDCPGCGLTRSFVAMGNGEWEMAFEMHRIGPLIYLMVLLQIPLRAYGLITGRGAPWRVEAWAKGAVIWVLFAALWLNWFYALYTHEAWR